MPQIDPTVGSPLQLGMSSGKKNVLTFKAVVKLEALGRHGAELSRFASLFLFFPVVFFFKKHKKGRNSFSQDVGSTADSGNSRRECYVGSRRDRCTTL